MQDEKSLKILLWLVAVGFFMQTLDSTIVNTALPAMAASLGESPLRMQSVVVAYGLTMAMLIPASGWLADRWGTRRVFLSAIALFVLGSLLCALSRSLSQLVAARVVQGLGGAMLLPVGRLVVLRAFPREKFLPAMSFVAVPGLIGPMIGPTLGGWLAQTWSWHWIFLINVPVGVLGCAATLAYMPDSRSTAQTPFDWAGYLLLAFGMVAISLSLDGLAGLGFQSATVRLLLIFGLVSLAAYVLHAVHHPRPLFAPHLFQVHTFSVGVFGNLFARIGSGSMPFLIPLLLQLGLGYSALEAGLMMLPVAIAGILAKPMATRLITRFGYRRMLLWNTALVGVCMASFALITPLQPLALRIVQLAVFGAVNSLQFTAMNTVVLKDLGEHQASAGNSLVSMVMMLSMSLGVATAGALLAGFGERAGEGAGVLGAFHATFVCVGLITLASSWIFWQLKAEPAVEQPKTGPVEIG
jgi:EmrB/QacA subfamily drug resistance transporter